MLCLPAFHGAHGSCLDVLGTVFAGSMQAEFSSGGHLHGFNGPTKCFLNCYWCFSNISPKIWGACHVVQECTRTILSPTLPGPTGGAVLGGTRLPVGCGVLSSSVTLQSPTMLLTALSLFLNGERLQHGQQTNEQSAFNKLVWPGLLLPNARQTAAAECQQARNGMPAVVSLASKLNFSL